MVAGRPKLGHFLLESGAVTVPQIETAMEHQAQSGARIGAALISLGLCTDFDLARALAQQLEIPFVDLRECPPDPRAVALIPRELAMECGVLPLRMEGTRLLVAARDPYDIRVDETIRQATRLEVTLAAAPESQLSEGLQQQYYDHFFAGEMANVIDMEEEHEPEEPQLSVHTLIAAGEQVSTIRVVNSLIADAVRRGASDLHIEPEQTRVRVRYRIDGRMDPVLFLPLDQLQSVMARLKIMGGMDIAESRKPQDGGCQVRVENRRIELRIATLRGVHGEIAVVRLLGQDPILQSLDALGFELPMQQRFRGLLAQRSGLILITGPTGSGKTTTLYASLTHLNQDDVNIMTVEDPVETRLTGINQIQVQDRAGRSFASTLRAMLRQDPDVIMVGEVRDTETADIACRAALTGHLVLSTLHTQHTLGSIVRLIDMGVAPWMVAACVNGILAQRPGALWADAGCARRAPSRISRRSSCSRRSSPNSAISPAPSFAGAAGVERAAIPARAAASGFTSCW
jgi:type IV pilus assembly protein PilB